MGVIEIWTDVIYCPAYEVSDLGRVRNKNTGRVLKTIINERGYERVMINPIKRYFYVHRLVLLCFLGDPKDNEEADHINRNPLDNQLNNLRWFDKTKNRKRGNALRKRKSVTKLSKMGTPITTYYSAKLAAEINGTNEANIRACCLGKRKTHKGFKWIYN